MGKLTIWTWGEYANVARKAVEIYQDEYVDSEQEIEVVELTESEIFQNLNAQGPGDRISADIIMASDEFIRKSGLVNGENFVVLNDLIEESAYLENRIETVRDQEAGSIYGLPFTTEPAALFYRKDVFQNAGVETVGEEITWDNLLSLGVQVKEQSGKYLLLINPLVTRALLYSTGYYCYNDDQEQSAENNLCVLDLYNQIKESGLYKTEDEPFDYASESTQNTYSAFIGSSFLLSTIKNSSNADQWAAMKLPTSENFTNQVNLGGYSWLVTQNDNSAAAVEFLNNVFSGNEELIVYMAERNMISSAVATANVLSEAAADMEFGGDILHKLSVISAAAVLPVQGEYSEDLFEVLQNFVDKVCVDEMPVDEAKDRFSAYVNDYPPTDDSTKTINIADSSVTMQKSALNTAYKAGEGLVSLKKEIPLAGKAVGQVDLSSGDLTMAFVGVSAENSVMGMPILHVYDSRNPNENFRLNVSETLRYDEPNYVYTDGNGAKHTFKEKYYYLDELGEKTYIEITEKENITSTADGRLTYEDKEIFVEYCSASGLKAVTAAEGYNDSEYLEKRQTEYKQLEEQVKAYEKALKDYVVVKCDNGSLSTITTLQDLSTGKFEEFKSSADEEGLLLMSKESLQYQSLIMQQDAATKEIVAVNILAPDSENVSLQSIALRSSIYEITSTLQRHIAWVKAFDQSGIESMVQAKLFNPVNGESATATYITETCTVIENKLQNDEIVEQTYFDRFNNSALFNEFEPETDSEDEEVYETRRDGYSLKALFRQRNLYLTQLAEQNTSVELQINRILSEKDQAKAQLDQYYKEYYNKNAELQKLKQSLPMSFVTDGKQVKGFNEQGMLVAVYDKYENYVGIEYETVLGKTRVSRLYDNTGKQVLCTYDFANRLISITDIHGQKTEYFYSEEKLSEVKFGSNDSLQFGYSGNVPVSVSGVENLLETEIEYGTNTLTFIQKSKLKKIGKELELADSMEERSRVTITFTYGADDKIIAVEAEDGKQKTAYELDEQNQATKYVEYANGRVVQAETYSYEYDATTGALTKTTATSAPKSELYATSLAENAFDDGVVETTEYNEFCQPIKKDWSARRISSTANTEAVEKTYVYDLENRLTEVKTKRVYAMDGTYTEKETYAYSQKGELVKTEKYLVGAELSLGKQIEERIYDEKGNLTKRYTYNSLDGTSKYYLAEAKAATENSETGVAYGYDEFGNVTSVSGNTADGEENSTQKEYQYGLLTKLVSGNEQVEYEYDEKQRVTKIGRNGNAEYAVFTYTSTDSGEEITERNANGEERTLQKDTQDRLVQESYTVGETQKKSAYEYEQANRLRSITESENETETRKRVFAYNPMDKVKWYKEIENGETKINEKYFYDDFERLGGKEIIFGEELTQEEIFEAEITGEELVAPESMQYTYRYEDTAQGRLEEIGVLGLTIQPKYDILNRPKGKTLCIDGEKLAEEQIVYRKIGDHATDMPSAVYFGSKSAGMYALNEHVKYSYDENGNIQKVFENGALVARYEYDTLNRLVREDNKKFGKTRLFTYDNNGNILSKRETEFTLKTDVEECTFTRIDYAYDGDRLISYNGATFAYDAVGNPTTYRGHQTEWTMGKLTAYGGTTFTYDMQGRRLTKGDITFTYDGNGNLITQSDGLLFLYDHTGVAGVQYDGRIYLYRKDAQGNIIAILNNTGKVVVRYAYNAWGGHTVEVVDSACNDLAYENPFRYRGYYYDWETGLYYLHARYYDPTTGRFISPDGIEYLDPETVNGLNLYAYCGNNPIMYADPSGRVFITSLLVSIGIGALFGGAIAGVTAYNNGARGWDLVGSIAGGTILGGGMGAIMAIGGAAGLASMGAGLTGFSLSPSAALGVSLAVGAGAGLLSYTAETLISPSKQWSWSEFGENGSSGLLKGAVTFGVAFAGAEVGLFDKVFFKDVLGKELAKDAFSYNIAKGILASIIPSAGRQFFTQATYYLGESLTKMFFVNAIAAAARWIIDKIFGT